MTRRVRAIPPYSGFDVLQQQRGITLFGHCRGHRRFPDRHWPAARVRRVISAFSDAMSVVSPAVKAELHVDFPPSAEWCWRDHARPQRRQQIGDRQAGRRVLAAMQHNRSVAESASPVDVRDQGKRERSAPATGCIGCQPIVSVIDDTGIKTSVFGDKGPPAAMSPAAEACSAVKPARRRRASWVRFAPFRRRETSPSPRA